ncbi:MAG: Txe/YoeB family addiction module toxin [Rickettsiales bacterium]
MVNYSIVVTKQAAKESKNLVSAGLKQKVDSLLKIIAEDPFAPYPTYEKLSGEMKGYYSRRINIQHRLVYQVFEEEKIVKILRMWTHYE